MNAFVIHDISNKRRQPYVEEIRRRTGASVFQAVMHDNPVRGCSLSHKTIIERARESEWPSVWILEDDCQLSWDFDLHTFTETSERAIELGYDIVVGGSANGQEPYPSGLDGLVAVKRWSSCHCWVVSSRAYDSILRLDHNIDIDVAASSLPCKKCVMVPFVARQIPSWSALQKRDVDYSNWFNESERRLMAVAKGCSA